MLYGYRSILLRKNANYVNINYFEKELSLNSETLQEIISQIVECGFVNLAQLSAFKENSKEFNFNIIGRK